MNRISYPLRQRMKRTEVADLHDALLLLLGHGAVLRNDETARRENTEALSTEKAKQTYGAATSKLVARFQEERGLAASGTVDEATASAINGLLEELGAVAPSKSFEVSGRVISRVSASVGGLRVEVVDKDVGGDITLGDSDTDSHGNYKILFSDTALKRRRKEQPDIQARAFSSKRFLASSEVRYDASPRETLNVLLDDETSSALRSEYETLTGALSAHFNGNLSELKETGDRQDVTYLANKSGWDARAVALAALAEQFSTGTASSHGNDRIEPPLFYALFRAGLPANEAAIYRTQPKTVAAIWNQAVQQGVIPGELEERIPAAVEEFQQVAAQQLLEGPPLAGVSSFKALLAITLGEDSERQQQFADLYARYEEDSTELWTQVLTAFGAATADRLRLDGRLAYLTLNNAPLIGKLHAAAGPNGLRNPSQLAASGFYSASKWEATIGTGSVPPEIPGKNDGEKRERYAELLAAQVRLSFPTAVVAQMVKSGETPVAFADAQSRVHTFLTQHEGKFEIGMQPVAQYVAQHNLEVDADVTREITRIQRVYQITPDDESMNGLLSAGIDSAYAAVRYDQEEFVRAFKDSVGGEQNARLIHAKAEQVHTAVVNLAITFLAASGAPGIGVHSPASIINPTPSPPANAADVLAYSTLESLVGEMDYCACEHCRSILSPAAYLVDLLLFLDRPASEVPAGYVNPQRVLLDHRPDIEHLPLTCENTNTPVPYIDLVNETLEYYITNKLSLKDYAGHSTDGSARPEELLASPKFVNETAYTILEGEDKPFPPPLPFHQRLETLRRYFDRFDAHLPEVMDALRKGDSLERASANEYGWRDIWMETLGLSRAEHRLLTERRLPGGTTNVALTVKRLYGFDSSTPDADVRAVLDNAKSFSRRVGITYEQLVEILRTRFINPNSQLLPRLERLGVPFATLEALKTGTITDAEFDDLVAPGLDLTQYGGDVKAWVKDDDNYGRIMSLLTLTNPVDGEDICDFDAVELRYANPDPDVNQLRFFEFVRLIRFIRLWRKLGWSVEETDKAISALYPAAQAPDDASDAENLELLDEGFRELLLSLGVVKRIMDLLKLTPRKDLLSLLACFSPIDTHGESSLYRQVFLSPSQLDDAFTEDGYGNHLADPEAKLFHHAGALRAAFSLTAGEFSEIVAALGYDTRTALTLENVSAVFRRGWLARRLKLSIREFLLITRLTGYEPFETPNPVGPAILRLVEFVGRLRALGVKPVEALYLVWNQDVSGRSAPAEEEVLGLARTLRSALAAIEGEFALVDDPDGSIARARMALVYGNEATDLFFGLLENTFVTVTEYSHGQATLEQSILEAAPGRIGYDDFRKQLSYAGVLSTVGRDDLKAVGLVTSSFRAAVDDLYAENQAVVGPFFTRYPELLLLYDAYVASADPVENKRSVLLEAFLPELKSRRKRQQALQSVSAGAGTEVGFASVLLDDAAVLHAASDSSRPALDDLIALEKLGLTVHYFYADSASGTPHLTHSAEANLDYTASGTSRLPSNPATPSDPRATPKPISGVWSGFLEAPENEFYNVRIDTDAAAVTLMVNGTGIKLEKREGPWRSTVPIELRAGALYAVRLAVEKVTSNLAVRWQTAGRGWEIIPAAYLYSATLMDNLREAYIRHLRAVGLATALELTAAETAHLGAHLDYHIDGEAWLNRLPVTGGPTKATAAGLFEAFQGLLDFGRIKANLSSGDERLLDVIRSPDAATADAESLLYVVTRWKPDSLSALLSRFGHVVADLAHVETLRQVYDAYTWVEQLGISASALIDATTNEPTASDVRGLEVALRARYDESSWLDVLRPINDEMRALQRDALVAYVLHQMRSHAESAHIDTPEKLFEYFLMDVEMDPCMLTSRIRHALSSVQLFIERCLLNLEPRVSATSIKAKQWDWMKRYRVWEANRKVFLYPENWLEPELRDDQSPFFKETVSELLQGDITEDSATQAFVSYLTKLEEVAKLEVCGVHYEQSEPGKADDIAHVIARTAGANRKYFYRRREHGDWTPWEKVSLDIEDNPILPVVWNDRLFLFWLKLVKETEPTKPTPPTPPTTTLADTKASDIVPTTPPKLVVKAILSWSEFLGGKWQPGRTSDPATPLLVGTFDLNGSAPFDRSQIKLRAGPWKERGLSLIVSDQLGSDSSFLLYNTFSTPELEPEPDPASPARSLDTPKEFLTATYPGTGVSHAVLKNVIADRTIEPRHVLAGNPWEPPFFYEDSRHVFYVTTDGRLPEVGEWPDFGIVIKTQKEITEMPGLVFPPAVTIGLELPVLKGPGFGVIDPTPIIHYITEDAYIKTAIGTPGTVLYGDNEIGPSGSQLRTGSVR